MLVPATEVNKKDDIGLTTRCKGKNQKNPKIAKMISSGLFFTYFGPIGTL